MRTFIAIEIPATVHSLIRQRQQTMEAILVAANQGQAMKWTPPAKVHITLRFLGATTDHQCQVMQRAISAISAAQKPFVLSIGETGCFPNRQTPHVVWLGIQDEGNPLFNLQQQVEQAAQSAGFAVDTKPFTPHLTIGRLRRAVTRPQSRAIGRSLAQQLTIDASARQPSASFEVSQIVHIQSQLQSTGSVYTPLQTYNFGEAPIEE